MNAISGELVDLSVPDGDAAAPLVAPWFCAVESLRSSRGPRFLTPGEAKRVLAASAGALLARTKDGAPAGVVLWNARGAAGGYAVEYIAKDRDTWKGGRGSEALSLVVDHLFGALAAHRVQILTGLFDAVQVEVLEGVGFRVEGLLRDYFFLDGVHEDAAVCSLLREEYLASRLGGGTGVIPQREKEEALGSMAAYLRRHPLDLVGRLGGRTGP